MQRRNLLRHTVLTGAALFCTADAARAGANRTGGQLITIIDLDRCDGCRDRAVPLCVSACRKENKDRVPEPQKPIRPYWPKKKFEDFSERRDEIDRLTPYNLLYVETLSVNGRDIHLPRRCMHCFDAPCRKLCPFGAIDKTKEGAVAIDAHVCFGGAKCRDVCPWHIPQRQAGVGLYLDVAPKFAGGGIMFKCDLCAERLSKGEQPACIPACPRKAMMIGSLEEMTARLGESLNGRHVYGRTENGGTATWYVSSIPFETIDAAHRASVGFDTQGRPGFPNARPALASGTVSAGLALTAPIAALGGAVMLRRRRGRDGKED